MGKLSESLVWISIAEQEKLDRELLWCVQKLEIGLSAHTEGKKVHLKQAEEAARVIKILRNPSASLVKKRQAMRSTFGDYRKKMQEEEKKYTKTVKKVSMKATDKSMQQKSTYLRKAVHKCSGITSPGDTEENKKSVVDINDEPLKTTSQENFKFNFNVEDKDLDSQVEKMSITEDEENQVQVNGSDQTTSQLSHYKLQPSDNTFRFKFEVN